MDHNNSEKKYCTCQHGMCKDHSPEWGKIREVIKPNPGIFGAKTYWLTRCCGKGMARLKKVKWQECKKCERERKTETTEFAHCECCGYHRDFHTDDPNDYSLIP